MSDTGGIRTALALKNVTLELGGQRILDDLSMDFREGHIHAVIGPNGAGKAHVTHEAAIGSVDCKQLETLMSRGLDEDQAVDLIIQGLLGR